MIFSASVFVLFACFLLLALPLPLLPLSVTLRLSKVNAETGRVIFKGTSSGGGSAISKVLKSRNKKAKNRQSTEVINPIRLSFSLNILSSFILTCYLLYAKTGSQEFA